MKKYSDTSDKIFFGILTIFSMKVGGGGLFAQFFTSFSSVTFAKVGIRPQKFLAFSFDPFDGFSGQILIKLRL